jgi:hypothetical protein
MYDLKAGLDWWNIYFLNNHYFYACITIGLLIALSDPRVTTARDATGKRTIYLHSKFWGVVKIIRGLVSQYSVDGVFPTRISGLIYDDKVSLRLGLAWKGLEFLVGTLVIGPPLAQGLALQYLMISKWVAAQNISWITLLQRTTSVLWTRLFTSDLPTGLWLIDNSPILEFLTFIRPLVNMVCILWGIRQGISLIINVLRGNVPKVFKSIVLIALTVLTPILLGIPTQVFDITTPFYVRSLVIGELTHRLNHLLQFTRKLGSTICQLHL